MKVFFELAEGRFLRRCLQLEDPFSELRGSQLEKLIQLCVEANESEGFYRGVFEEEWLRTAFILEDPGTSEEGRHIRYSVEGPVLSDISFRITFHSNVVPREGYRRKLLDGLRELRCKSSWPRIIRGSSRFRNDRGFFDRTLLHKIYWSGKSLEETLQERRRLGWNCDFAQHMQTYVFEHRPRSPLLDVMDTDIDLLLQGCLGIGSEGEVRKIVWRKGLFAMKSYKFNHIFDKEVNIALRVSHPNVVHAFGHSVDETQKPCLLMELMGPDLHRFAHEKARVSETAVKPPLSREDSIDVLLQVANAMKFLHERNVVHRDLKPQNILISHFEISGKARQFVAKVSDFGSAEMSDPISGLWTFRKGGTARYSAPEQLRYNEASKEIPVDKVFGERIDVYSFGVVAYEILTGDVPFASKNGRLLTTGIRNGSLTPSRLRPWRFLKYVQYKYPFQLIDLVESCCNFNPERRPSFSKICEELETSKCTLQSWEKGVATFWTHSIMCLFAIALHYTTPADFWLCK